MSVSSPVKSGCPLRRRRRRRSRYSRRGSARLSASVRLWPKSRHARSLPGTVQARHAFVHHVPGSVGGAGIDDHPRADVGRDRIQALPRRRRPRLSRSCSYRSRSVRVTRLEQRFLQLHDPVRLPPYQPKLTTLQTTDRLTPQQDSQITTTTQVTCNQPLKSQPHQGWIATRSRREPLAPWAPRAPWAPKRPPSPP